MSVLFRTQQIAPGIFAVGSPAGSFYVAARAGSLACFDAGFSASQARQGFARLGLDPAAVTHVFLTHSDRDHVGGLPLFPGAAVFMSEREQAVIDGSEPRSLLFLKRRNRSPGPFTPVADGQTISAGPFRVTALWTPGHTPGSTSYLLEEEALFTGDLLALKEGRARPSPRWICNDVEEDERSIHRLAARVPRAGLLCTGHSGWTSDYRAALASYFPVQ